MDGQTSATFRVAACNDAHVALFDNHQTDVAYEVIIGGSGNAFTIIRRKRLQDNKAEVSGLKVSGINYH